jgi:hypothetical protein
MATRYVALVEGFLPASAKLLKVTDDSVDAVVVAAGQPTAIRQLADDLNATLGQDRPETEADNG